MSKSAQVLNEDRGLFKYHHGPINLTLVQSIMTMVCSNLTMDYVRM